jgi:hypothetical protein
VSKFSRAESGDSASPLLEERSQCHCESVDTLGGVFAILRSRPSTAVCISGGGIRSATFGLGVLQGLARHDLLEQFDYISTVSGGGYIELAEFLDSPCGQRAAGFR